MEREREKEKSERSRRGAEGRKGGRGEGEKAEEGWIEENRGRAHIQSTGEDRQVTDFLDDVLWKEPNVNLEVVVATALCPKHTEVVDQHA